MRLLYFSDSRLPTEKGYGIQIIKMCYSFAALTHAVTLLLPTKNNPRFKNVDPFGYYQVKRNFQIQKIKCLDPDWLAKKMPQGIYIKIQSLFWLISLFFYLLFKSQRSEYIFYTRDEFSLALLQLFSSHVVWEAHTLPRRQKYYLKYWQRCRKIVAITQGLKDELIALGVPAEKIIVAPDAVDLSEFEEIKSTKKELRQRLGLPTDKNIIMYTGHLYDWKGVQGLADAAQFLTNQESVVFVGGSDENFDLGAFRAKNKNNQRVLILGYQPYDQIPAYLKSADVLVLPNSAHHQKSKTWTSPLKLFMYMASDVPIVAANLPSLNEILSPENAIFYQPDDPADMANALKKLLTNQALAAKISARAHSDVQSRTWSKRAQKIVDFINF